jgi:hypothetical protein
MSFPFKQPQPWKQFLGSNPNDMSEMLNVVYQIDIQIDDTEGSVKTNTANDGSCSSMRTKIFSEGS